MSIKGFSVNGSVQKYEFSALENISEITQFATPEMFGAKGDGVTDDTAAITAMFESGFHVFVFSKKTYNVAGITAPNLKDAVIIGNGATLNNIRTDAGNQLNYSHAFMLTNDEHTRTAEEHNGFLEIFGLTFNMHGSDFTNYNNTYPDANQILSLTMYDSVHIHDCNFLDSFMGAIQTWGCRKVCVEKCYFKDIGNESAEASGSHVRNCVSAFATCYGNSSSLHVDCDNVVFKDNKVDRADFACSQRAFPYTEVSGNYFLNTKYFDEDFPGWDGHNYSDTLAVVKNNVSYQSGCAYTYSVSTPTNKHHVIICDNVMKAQTGMPFVICSKAGTGSLVSVVVENNDVICDVSTYTGSLTAWAVIQAIRTTIANNRIKTFFSTVFDLNAGSGNVGNFVVNDNIIEADNATRIIQAVYGNLVAQNNKASTSAANASFIHSQGAGYNICCKNNEANTSKFIQMQKVGGTYEGGVVIAEGNIASANANFYNSLSATDIDIVSTHYNIVKSGLLNLPTATVKSTADNITA